MRTDSEREIGQHLLTKYKNIDSAFVYQPKQGFTVGLFSSIQRVGIDMTTMYAIKFNDLQILSRVDDLNFRGYFHDWKVKLLFTYKF